MLDRQMEPLDRGVKEEAQRDKMALLLQTQPWSVFCWRTQLARICAASPTYNSCPISASKSTSQ